MTILPLEDNHLLAPGAVRRFLDAARAAPWSAIVRARRGFIDGKGAAIDMPDWVPFEPRRYDHGMTANLHDSSRPYIIRRSLYDGTEGWQEVPEDLFVGGDCDIFARLEEQGIRRRSDPRNPPGESR